MRLQKTSIARFILLTLLLLAAVIPLVATGANAQTSSNYWVTVKPTGDSQMYTTVGRNWTLSFEALWSYGPNSGQPISNATVTMQVSGASEGSLASLKLNTTSGTFTFNYSSSIADKITFKPTEVKTSDGNKWSSAQVTADGAQAYGLQSASVTVLWDTFQVTLLSHDTDKTGKVAVSVDVTYLLLPQEGLTLPSQDTYSNQTVLPKIVSGANVTIDGVKAQEDGSTSVYSADVSTVFPTAYVLVKVSQSGWTTTNTAFSFPQKANGVIWNWAVVICLVFAAVSLPLYFMLIKKPTQPSSPSIRSWFPLIGGLLLMAVSIVSLYWSALAAEATIHGFNWLILAVTGICSFAVGMVGAIVSLKKGTQALVIFSICVPLLINVAVVNYAFGLYQLADPWLLIVSAMAASIISGLLISNADEHFRKQETAPTN